MLYFDRIHAGYESLGDLVLSGGSNSIKFENKTEDANYLFIFSAKKMVSEVANSTLLLTYNYKSFFIDPEGFMIYNGAIFDIQEEPEKINGILPYMIANHNSPTDFYFWGSLIYSTSSQSSWNSAALNVSINENQTLTANRTINSLRFLENRTVNLNVYTLSVNAGAFLSGRAGRAQFINNGTLTTAQDRYFFHIYGTRLSVSSTISGVGKALVKSGPGELVLYGNQANTYTGTTYVHEGTLVLDKSPNAKAVGNIIVGDGGGVDTLRLDQSHQIDDLATVRLKGASRAKNMTAQGVLQFNGSGGLGLTEKIHTLQIEGQGVINFAGGTLLRPNVLETMRVLLPTADDTLFIRNWIEYADYFLVSRALAPDASELARIWFEGWAPGAKLINYNASHWEIVPYGSPEPATYGAIIGAVGIGLVVWRKRKRTTHTPPTQ